MIFGRQMGLGIILVGLSALALIAVASGVLTADRLFTLILFALFFVSHMFMHGGHGGHGGHGAHSASGGHDHGTRSQPSVAEEDDTAPRRDESGHGCH